MQRDVYFRRGLRTSPFPAVPFSLVLFHSALEEEDDEDNASTTDNGNEAEQFMEAEENHSQETVETPYVLSQKEELGQVQCTADRLLSKMDFRSSVARKRTGRKASGRGAQVQSF